MPLSNAFIMVTIDDIDGDGEPVEKHQWVQVRHIVCFYSRSMTPGANTGTTLTLCEPFHTVHIRESMKELLDLIEGNGDTGRRIIPG